MPGFRTRHSMKSFLCFHSPHSMKSFFSPSQISLFYDRISPDVWGECHHRCGTWYILCDMILTHRFLPLQHQWHLNNNIITTHTYDTIQIINFAPYITRNVMTLNDYTRPGAARKDNAPLANQDPSSTKKTFRCPGCKLNHFESERSLTSHFRLCQQLKSSHPRTKRKLSHM